MKPKFPEEFKQEAVKQVVERGYSVSDVAKRLGVSIQSLYKWVKEYSPNVADRYEAELKEVRRASCLTKASRCFVIMTYVYNYFTKIGNRYEIINTYYYSTSPLPEWS